MKNISPFFRIFFWIILIGFGFVVGTAWNKVDTTHQAPDSIETAERNPAPPSRLTPSETSIINLFEKAAPSVIFITTSSVRRDFWTRNIYEIPKGTGSGFVWNKSGHIITNYHVIQGADKAQVTMADGTTWDATLVGRAPEKDLAVLKIEAPSEQLQPIQVGTSEDLRVGQSVLAIGNPFGLDQTLTTGIISALGREINSVAGIPIRDVIQTDAAINPGNSGGPLLDSSGKLIGVNTAIYSPSGAYAGIGFSIPADVVNWVVPELIVHGKLMRPSMGLEPAPSRINRQLDIAGVLILEVYSDGPAEKAGIQPTYRDRYGRISLGDIIIGLNDEAIKSKSDLILALENYKVDDVVLLKFIREGAEMEVELTLESE